MPAAHTKHPNGRPPIATAALSAVWFEEGDGVAILEDGEPIAVIPGWSDLSRRMPGYAEDVIGQTPFGWSLDDAMEGLGQRISPVSSVLALAGEPRLAGHCSSRRSSAICWQGSVPAAATGTSAAARPPLVGVSERPPVPRRPFTVLSTVGMSGQRMPVVEQTGEGADSRARIELALATTMPSAEAARIFLWLAQYPWREVTWLGSGHSVPWYHEPATFPLGGGNEAVLLLDDPSRLPGPEVPRLDGFRSSNEPVRWLWVVPINERERRLARERSSASLVTQLAAQRRSWVYSP